MKNVCREKGRKGHETVRVVGESGTETYLHSLYDPHKEAEGYVPDSISHETVVFLGSGLGFHIPLTIARHPRIRRVIIIERYPELAENAAALLADTELKVDIVTSVSDSPAAPVEIPPDIDAETIQIISHPPSVHANPKWYSRIHSMFATAGSAPITRKAGRRGPLKILALYGAYYCQAECIRGFEQLGHKVVTLDYRERESDLVDAFHGILLENTPDLVFTVNMRGLDNRGVMSGILSGLGIPLVLWFVDSPEFILYGETTPPPDISRVFVWDKTYLEPVKALGYDPKYLPLAADTTLSAAAVRRDSFRADISFVGNSLCSGFLNRLASRIPKNPALSGIAERAVSSLFACRGSQLDKIEEIISEADFPLRGGDELLFFRAYILHSATTRYRTALLERLLPHGLSFFGDPVGWEKVFGKGIDAHADVNYFHETPAVYASAEVNFNATSFQMPMGVNQRVFDVPLCGGFLLTDRQDDLFDLFADDEVAVYDGVGDVADKAEYYLARPDERQAIAAKARKRVLDNHTYRHRMGQILTELFK